MRVSPPALIIAERLKSEFYRKGATASSVAKRTTIPFSIVKNYLDGNQELDINEVNAICDAINLNFFRLISNSYSETKLHFRNIKKSASMFSAKIEECFLMFCESLPTPEIPIVKLDDFFDDRIALIGIIQPIIQQIKSQYGISIDEVLKNINMPVIPVKAKRNEFDAFLLNSHPYYAICVNESSPPNRIKFSLAHELSHFLFDREKFIPVDENTMVNLFADRFSPQQRPEFVATKFAQYFLLPFDELQTLCSNWKNWFETLNFERSQEIIDKNKISIDVLLNGIRDLCEIYNISIPYANLKDHLALKLNFLNDLSIYDFLQAQKNIIRDMILKDEDSYSDSVLDEIFNSLKMNL